jgi:hypothetical protein
MWRKELERSEYVFVMGFRVWTGSGASVLSAALMRSAHSGGRWIFDIISISFGSFVDLAS